MGNLCGCCNENDKSSEEATPRRPIGPGTSTQLSAVPPQEIKRKPTPVTERDRDAQSAAAAAAEARQQKFESSPGGRAAIKGAKNARDPVVPDRAPDTSKDWLS